MSPPKAPKDIRAEAYGFTYDSAKSINENADALASFIAVRQRWYKTDDDGNYTFEGTENFIKDVEKVIDSNSEAASELKNLGVEWSYIDGALNIDFNNILKRIINGFFNCIRNFFCLA